MSDTATGRETKRAAIDALRREWARLWELIQGVPREKMTTPNAVGVWSIRDLLVHIGDWHEEALVRIPEVLAGKAVFWDTYDDAWNEGQVARKAHLSVEEALARADQTHRLFLALCKSLPLDAFSEESPVFEWIEDCGAGHYREHADDIEAWLKGEA